MIGWPLREAEVYLKQLHIDYCIILTKDAKAQVLPTADLYIVRHKQDNDSRLCLTVSAKLRKEVL